MAKKIRTLAVFIVILTLVLPVSAFPKTGVAFAAGPISFTILHTNDFHGQLEPSGSNPGMARVAAVVNGVRTAVGANNVLLVDAGDEMQGSLLSNLQKGLPTIATFNAMGYNAATFGNHEFDWGQTVLNDRTTQAAYPFLSANIVKNDTGTCSTAGWVVPDQFKVTPYVIQTLAATTGTVKVAFIGVTTAETPTITIASATQGLCFKDPFDSIVHYYDTLKANADVIVVLSHLGFTDGGYGYGIPVYGDQTLADKLFKAGKPVPLIIGGHSHTNVTLPAPVIDGVTTVAQAYYNGRQVGRADLTFDPATKAVTVAWQKLAVSTTGAQDPAVNTLINSYASDPTYQTLINQPVGYSAVDLSFDYNGDNMMGDFIDDAIYGWLNSDTDPTNDVDMFFNNAGGIRTPWCWNGTDWINTGCVTGTHTPGLLTYGDMFTVLPFGNATAVGKMTGARILELLNQSATLFKGTLQPAGIRFKFYRYSDSKPGPQPFAWGAFDVCVVNKTNPAQCDPLDMNKTYSVGTNEFLAPAGQDGFVPFKYMTNVTYWGDMLNAVNAYVAKNYGTAATAYMGPKGDGKLDGRVTRDGTDVADSGSIKPITILHNDDSHGNLNITYDAKTGLWKYAGYTQLASLIKQEQAHNPTRTLLLNGGDQIQGDAMMYYFKSSYSGFAADGSALPDALKTQPLIAVMNSLGYDAMTLGNHEFNFGSAVFDGIFKQTTFPLLAANLTDSGAYGLSTVGPGGEGVKPYIEKTLGGIPVAIVGLTNPRVPNYELPSNIPGLTFTDPIATTQGIAPGLKASGDVVIALTHIGFTSDPNSVDYDPWVDTNLATQAAGVDAILGAHSHTNPANPGGGYKYLPTIIGGPNNTPVIVGNSYRYNSTLSEIVLGVRAKAGGGYEVVSRAGTFLSVNKDTPEDAATKAIIDPYATRLATYYNQVVGQTTVPIDTQKAFTEETNGANLQADASVWALNQKGIYPDFHLSGAMTNNLMAAGATEAAPVTLKISDMFAGMPYENSLVTMKMNGPQLKAVLERAYRNYFYYKYVPGRGGYSYYTTCMIDINNVGRIFYRDLNPTLPDGNNVVGLVFNGKTVDFTDASTFYLVSTVNYLAAGSCNFNDAGKSLWPLDQIVNDTQYYVRDVVIDYITAQGKVSPKVEGRLLFGDTVAPVVTIKAPVAKVYERTDGLTLDFSAVDGADGTTPSFAPPSGVKTLMATLDGAAVKSGDVVDLFFLALGDHKLVVTAADYYGNTTTQEVTFSVEATLQTLSGSVKHFYDLGLIDNEGIRESLLAKLRAAEAALKRGQLKTALNNLDAFFFHVMAQRGKHITVEAADLLISDLRVVIADLTAAPAAVLDAEVLVIDRTIVFVPAIRH